MKTSKTIGILSRSVISPIRSVLYPEDWNPTSPTLGPNNEFLHDFSYAGYQMSEAAIPTTYQATKDVDAAPYNAVGDGSTDDRAAIQSAINDAEALWTGGDPVRVLFGANTYAIGKSGSNHLVIDGTTGNGGVVLAGSDTPGNKVTFLKLLQPVGNDNRSDEAIKFDNGGDAHNKESGATTTDLTADAADRETNFPVVSSASYSVGDWVVVRGDMTSDLAADLDMDDPPTLGWDDAQNSGAAAALDGWTYMRKITVIPDSTHITVDIPIKFPLKTRDNARIYKFDGTGNTDPMEECGIQDLSIGMDEHPATAEFVDGDQNTVGKGAYENHQHAMLHFENCANFWILNVKTYDPGNTASPEYGYVPHVLSHGITFQRSCRGTLENCDWKRPQSRTPSGNGYCFRMTTIMDVLVKDCIATNFRHSISFLHLYTTGNVMLRVTTDTPRQDGGLASDHHQFLSPANLWDSCKMTKDFIEMKYRIAADPRHGHQGAHSVIWNHECTEAHDGFSDAILATALDWACVIGTKGAITIVKLTPVTKDDGGFTKDSSPTDYTELIGSGGHLSPQSLFEDQLTERGF